MRTFELAPGTDKNFLYIIFERLNTGGIPLKEMEIRNCIFRGDLNNLIKRLAADSDFIACVNQKDLSKRMNDRLMVLRFLAFHEKPYRNAQAGLKAFLNEFFADYQSPTEQKLIDFEKSFRKAMRACLTVFRGNAFRLRKVDGNGAGDWGSRVNAAIFQAVAVSMTQYDLGQVTRRADAITEEYIDLATSDKEWVDSVSRSTGSQTRIRYAFKTWDDRLRMVMEASEPDDTTRCFSRKLKEEHFKQDPTCCEVWAKDQAIR